VDDLEGLAERFEAHRAHLRAVAYRMLGSVGDADDAVQEAWLRCSRSDTGDVANLRGWLTTVVGRICLDMLRTRRSRREQPWDEDGSVGLDRREDVVDPQEEALLAESVGLALLVVLDALRPAERVAFVLHDIFAIPFDEIAPIVGRSPDAARMLASRARRRVHSRDAVDDTDRSVQRDLVDAFLSAARRGDFEALVAILDPDVVARADVAAAPAHTPAQVRGARGVARQAISFSRRSRFAQPALVDGAAGVVVAPRGRLTTVLTFGVRNGRIVRIDILADPARLRQVRVGVRDD
jgi:RNA polymerase sigma factor (sigma-70 family)